MSVVNMYCTKCKVKTDHDVTGTLISKNNKFMLTGKCNLCSNDRGTKFASKIEKEKYSDMFSTTRTRTTSTEEDEEETESG